MSKTPSKSKRADANEIAFRTLQEATGQAPKTMPPNPDAGKDANAVALGRKGGVARAKTMGKKKRSETAKKAAAARWKTSS